MSIAQVEDQEMARSKMKKVDKNQVPQDGNALLVGRAIMRDQKPSVDRLQQQAAGRRVLLTDKAL